MIILPAILTDSVKELEKTTAVLRGFSDSLHIDISDGKFVDGPKTFSLADVVDDCFTDFFVEAHVMAYKPLDYLDFCADLGIRRMIIHYEAIRDELSEVFFAIKERGMQVSLAINPGTTVGQLDGVSELIESALVMTVVPGKQGGIFIPEVLDKIQALRSFNANMLIGVDGGVKLETIPVLRQYALDYAVVGSAIVKTADPVASFGAFQKAIEV